MAFNVNPPDRLFTEPLGFANKGEYCPSRGPRKTQVCRQEDDRQRESATQNFTTE